MRSDTAGASSRRPCRLHRRRGRCRWRETLSPLSVSSCHTGSLRQPLRGPPLRLRSVPAGTRNETALARLGPARRATVAPRSLRSLVRPHHSRTAPGHSFRPRWLRCARVSQRDHHIGASTAPVNGPQGLQRNRGDRHVPSSTTSKRTNMSVNSSSLRARSALRRDARARRVRHPGHLGSLTMPSTR